MQKQDKLSAFGFRLHQSSNICTGKKHESWKYIRISTFVQVKNMNHENTQNQRKCIKIDTMYNSYEVNVSQIHIKWRKRNWKSPVNGPSLNLKLKMAAKIRRVHLWRFSCLCLLLGKQSRVDRQRQKKSWELLDKSSKHSESEWHQQRRLISDPVSVCQMIHKWSKERHSRYPTP